MPRVKEEARSPANRHSLERVAPRQHPEDQYDSPQSFDPNIAVIFSFADWKAQYPEEAEQLYSGGRTRKNKLKDRQSRLFVWAPEIRHSDAELRAIWKFQYAKCHEIAPYAFSPRRIPYDEFKWVTDPTQTRFLTDPPISPRRASSTDSNRSRPDRIRSFRSIERDNNGQRPRGRSADDDFNVEEQIDRVIAPRPVTVVEIKDESDDSEIKVVSHRIVTKAENLAPHNELDPQQTEILTLQNEMASNKAELELIKNLLQGMQAGGPATNLPMALPQPANYPPLETRKRRKDPRRRRQETTEDYTRVIRGESVDFNVDLNPSILPSPQQIKAEMAPAIENNELSRRAGKKPVRDYRSVSLDHRPKPQDQSIPAPTHQNVPTSCVQSADHSRPQPPDNALRAPRAFAQYAQNNTVAFDSARHQAGPSNTQIPGLNLLQRSGFYNDKSSSHSQNSLPIMNISQSSASHHTTPITGRSVSITEAIEKAKGIAAARGIVSEDRESNRGAPQSSNADAISPVVTKFVSLEDAMAKAKTIASGLWEPREISTPTHSQQHSMRPNNSGRQEQSGTGKEHAAIHTSRAEFPQDTVVQRSNVVKLPEDSNSSSGSRNTSSGTSNESSDEDSGNVFVATVEDDLGDDHSDSSDGDSDEPSDNGNESSDEGSGELVVAASMRHPDNDCSGSSDEGPEDSSVTQTASNSGDNSKAHSSHTTPAERSLLVALPHAIRRNRNSLHSSIRQHVKTADPMGLKDIVDMDFSYYIVIFDTIEHKNAASETLTKKFLRKDGEAIRLLVTELSEAKVAAYRSKIEVPKLHPKLEFEISAEDLQDKHKIKRRYCETCKRIHGGDCWPLCSTCDDHHIGECWLPCSHCGLRHSERYPRCEVCGNCHTPEGRVYCERCRRCHVVKLPFCPTCERCHKGSCWGRHEGNSREEYEERPMMKSSDEYLGDLPLAATENNSEDNCNGGCDDDSDSESTADSENESEDEIESARLGNRRITNASTAGESKRPALSDRSLSVALPLSFRGLFGRLHNHVKSFSLAGLEKWFRPANRTKIWVAIFDTTEHRDAARNILAENLMKYNGIYIKLGLENFSDFETLRVAVERSAQGSKQTRGKLQHCEACREPHWGTCKPVCSDCGIRHHVTWLQCTTCSKCHTPKNRVYCEHCRKCVSAARPFCKNCKRHHTSRESSYCPVHESCSKGPCQKLGCRGSSKSNQDSKAQSSRHEKLSNGKGRMLSPESQKRKNSPSAPGTTGRELKRLKLSPYSGQPAHLNRPGKGRRKTLEYVPSTPTSVARALPKPEPVEEKEKKDKRMNRTKETKETKLKKRKAIEENATSADKPAQKSTVEIAEERPKKKARKSKAG